MKLITLLKSSSIRLMHLWPFNDRIISLHSYPLYTDNARYLYEFIVRNNLHKKYNFRIIWIGSSKNEVINVKSIYNIEAFHKRDLKGIYNLINSRVFLFTHLPTDYRTSIPKGRRTITVFLNHGMAFKGSPFDPKAISRYMFEVDYVIATSRFMAHLQGGWHGVHINKFVVTGYPRNDVLLRPYAKVRAKKLLFDVLDMKLENDLKIILYTPTYRYYCPPKTMYMCRHPKSIEGEAFNGVLPLNREFTLKLDKLLSREKYILLIRYHPLEEPYRTFTLNVQEEVKRYNSFKLITTELLHKYGITLYDILPAIDILITDYSSIFYDFLLLNKPILFYQYDSNKYFKKRLIIIEKESMRYWLPGPVVHTQKDFLEALTELIKGNDQFSSDRMKIRNIVHYYKDDHSSERVWSYLIKPFIS